MKLVQILGTGCAKCDKFKQNAEEAVKRSGVEALVEKITDINGNVITGFWSDDDPGLGDRRRSEVGAVVCIAGGDREVVAVRVIVFAAAA